MNTKRQMPFLILVIVVFTITFSIHINGFDGLLTIRNIGIIILFLSYLTVNRWKIAINPNNDRNDKQFIILWFLFAIYSLFLAVINRHPVYDSHSAFRSCFNFLIMVVLAQLLLTNAEHSFERYAKALMIATTIQSLIVIACFLSPSVKSFIYQLQSFDENWLYYRTVGLGIAGAGGTVYLFCGLMEMSYYIVFYKSGILLYLMQFLTLFAIILVGRTGFYMAIVTILLSAVISMTNKDKKTVYSFFTMLLAVLLSIPIIMIVSSHVDINSSLLQSSFRRLSELWTSNKTLQSINEMDRPNITIISLILGTGIEKGYGYDGIRIWNDSGYIQRFFSFGYIPGIISYAVLAKYIYTITSRLQESRKKLYWVTMLILMLIIDYKEAFIFYLALPFTIIVSVKLETNGERNYEF